MFYGFCRYYIAETESGGSMNDEELINRIRQGDEAAAEELVRRYHPAILRYCKSRCGSWEMAEDLTQETFLRLFRYLSSYRNEGGRFKAYLFSIAARLCNTECKKPALASLDDAEPLADKADMLRRIEDLDQIRSLLERLPPEQRETVILRFGDGFSFPEIAKLMDCNKSTAQSRVVYALNAMRKELSHEG